MTNAKRLLMTVLALTLPGWASPATAQEAARAADDAVARLEQAAGGALRVTRAPGGGPARFLSVQDGRGIAVSGATAEARARTFLSRYGAAFGLVPGQELRLVRPSETDAVGMEHVRLQQSHQGIPVTGAEVLVHLRGGRVMSANGKVLAHAERFPTTALIGAAQAAEKARALVVKYHGAGEVELSAPRLEILDVALLGGPRSPGGLAWFVEASRMDVREFVWVDARRGMTLLHFNQLPHALKRTVYTANHGTKLPGTVRRQEGKPPATGPDADDVNNAYEFAGDTYDYFLTEHGRDSFDGKGGRIKSTVDYCGPDIFGDPFCPYENAFWNGKQMVYGHGWPAADDIAAHELTHAVTERTAGLFYYMQSGALNESYSDIFGEMVDQGNGAGTDGPAEQWLIGEDLPDGTLRSMSDPNVYGDPAKMTDPQFSCPFNGFIDGGGVHRNSGVPNHAFQLMADGGSFNSVTVGAVGAAKAAKIQYRALTTYLAPASEFLDNYNAVLQSCTDLVDTDGITSADCTEVQNALDAVEMTNPWPCDPPQEATPAFCSAGEGPVPVFADNLENIRSGKWKTTVQSGGNHWQLVIGNSGTPPVYYKDFPASGDYHFWAYDYYFEGRSSMEMTRPTPPLPANAKMQFNHAYGFDNEGGLFYDGGVLEYTTDNGRTWLEAGGLITAGTPYRGDVETGSGNPLGGRGAFVGQSWGYTASQLDLSSLEGQRVRFRFSIGTDQEVDDFGWFIDDVQVYSCAPVGEVSFSEPVFPATEVSKKATLTVTRTGGSAPLTVEYYTIESCAATAGEDYTEKTGTLTFGPGVNTQTIQIPVANDTLDDDGEEFSVGLRNVSAGGTLGAIPEALVPIIDNDVAGAIELAAATFTTGETGNAIIRLKRTGGLASGAVVHYATGDDTAQQPGDYTQTSGVVTFAAGQATATFTVPITPDTIDEGASETFTVTLDASGGGATLGPQQTATVRITDNDAGGTVQFKVAAVRVNESAGTASITVTRTGGTASAVSVDYQTQNGTAVDGDDFVATNGTLSFAAGQTSQTILVTLVNSTEPPVEPSETFTVQLSNPQGGASLGPRALATVTIVENQ